MAILSIAGCSPGRNDVRAHGSAAERLRPVRESSIDPSAARGTVYVPVYSSLYLGLQHQTVELAATLSIRNLSRKHVLVIDSVEYFDSAGRMIHQYLSQASELGTMASVEFVVQQADTAGGPGANFLVRWHGATGMDEPLLEAVMLGQSGSIGISFTSRGEPLRE